MPDFYLDISAVGTANEYQTYAATPVIGGNATDRPRPMDGNGKAQSATAAAVAIAELQITTLPSDGNTLSIGGSAAITAKTTVAAKNQFAIGATIATAATNLVALLNTFGTGNNQCDVTASTSVCQTALAIPYLYWARIKPGTTDTIQLFTRIAGADFNTANNTTSRVTQTGTWLNSGASSINFTEGVDGPFGYFANAGTVFGRALGAYGVLWQKPSGPTDPGAADQIHVRTKRGASNLTSYHSTTGGSITAASTIHHNFVYDDGSVWSGDSGVFTFDVALSNSGSQSLFALAPGAHICKSFYNFNFHVSSLVGSGGFLKISSVNGSGLPLILWDKVKFSEGVGVPTTSSGLIICAASGASIGGGEFVDCWLSVQTPRIIVDFASAYAAHARFVRPKFSAANMSGKWTGFIRVGSSGGSAGDVIVEVRGGEFDSANAFSADAPVVGTPVSGNARVVLDSVGNLDFSVAGYTASPRYGMYSFLYVSASEDRPFRYECGTHIVDWRNDASYPTLNSLLPSGAYWCKRLLWQPVSHYTRSVSPDKSSIFYQSSDGQKKIELELLVPDVFAVTKADIGLLVRYRDSTGVVRHESSLAGWQTALSGTAGNLDASSATWANKPAGFSAKKLSLTTAQPIKQNTEVTVTIMLYGAPATQQTLYINPEPQVVSP